MFHHSVIIKNSMRNDETEITKIFLFANHVDKDKQF